MSVTSRPKRNGDGLKDTTYFCKGRSASGKCEAPGAMDTARLDNYVHEKLTERFMSGDPGVWAVLHGDRERDEAKTAHEDAEVELKAYITTVSVTQVGEELYVAGLEARQEAVRQARRRLNEVAAAGSREFPPHASEWTAEDARADMARYVSSVVVARADPKRRRWQPIEERVSIIWRGQAAD